MVGFSPTSHPNRFLGVKFLINGKIHYGWIRVTVDSELNQRTAATITEYGYETIPNKRVLAGVPSNNVTMPDVGGRDIGGTGPSLGMLALGADGFTLWRQEDDVCHV